MSDLEQGARDLDHMTMDAMWARLKAVEEYLNDICDAWEAHKKLVDRPPGHGISDSDYQGPSRDEVEQHGDEVAAAWGRLEDALETACGAREGE